MYRQDKFSVTITEKEHNYLKILDKEDLLKVAEKESETFMELEMTKHKIGLELDEYPIHLNCDHEFIERLKSVNTNYIKEKNNNPSMVSEYTNEKGNN